MSTSPATLVTNDAFTCDAWGPSHPLSIHRHKTVLGLIEHLVWLEPGELRTCDLATPETLLRLHDRDYLEAFTRATRSGQVSQQDRSSYNFGVMENPIFDGLYERAAATVGGAILAAELALKGHHVFHPAGGTHHGQANRASGFCYFNDPAFAILTLLDAGADPVLYVDLDAHHGDGVETLLRDDTRVHTVSIHESDRWPHTGEIDDRAGGRARNLPVPKGFNDAELAYLVDNALRPLADRIQPKAVVITCGADALSGDPLSGMELSNRALLDAIDAVRGFAPVSVCLGGGGYTPWTVARFWAGLWGRIAGRDTPPDPLPANAQFLLASLECDLVDEEDIRPEWLTSLIDPVQSDLNVRPEIRDMACAVLL